MCLLLTLEGRSIPLFHSIRTDKIVNDSHNVLANKWSTTASVCSWIGVSCGAQRDRVSGLNLSHMSLSGYIPSEIGNLSFLAFVSIRNNTFQGSLPNELANLLHLPNC